MLLHKYTPYENAVKIINNHSLYWSNISNFNDPFEGLFTNASDLTSQARLITLFSSIKKPILQTTEIKQLINKHKEIKVISDLGKLSNIIIDQCHEFNKSLTTESFFESEKKMESFIRTCPGALNFLTSSSIMSKTGISKIAKKALDESYGILCLSKNSNNTLMWSHYASNHTGVMFTLDMNDIKIKSGAIKLNIYDVSYQNEFPHLDYNSILGINANLFPKENESYFKTIALSKSSIWKYEEERRAILKKTNNKNIYQVPLSTFNNITLGHAMSDEKKREISDLIKNKLPNTGIYTAKISEERYEIVYNQNT